MELEEIEKIYQKERILKTITIEIVNQCNWRCKHCYLDSYKQIIDKETIFKIIDDAKALGAFEIKLSGGEAMLHPDVVEIVHYIRRKYMNVIFLSNISILGEKMIDCIRRYGISKVETTVFSIKDAVHDEFVGVPGALRRTLHNIKILRDMGVEVLVKTWAVKSNVGELEEMEKFFKGLGCGFAVHVQIYSDIHGNMKLPKSERLSYEEYCHALYLHDKSVNRSLPVNNIKDNPICVEFLTSIYITSNGDVIPCAKYRKSISNIYQESLIDIWEGSERLKEIQNYCWKDCKDCARCKAKGFCVRCGAMSYIKGKSFLENSSATCLLANIRMNNYGGGLKGDLY